MKLLKLFTFLLFVSSSVFSQELAVYDLTCEYKTEPMGIDIPQPRLSWKIKASGSDVMQSAYSIRVATDPKFSSSGTVWKTGKVSSGESTLVTYEGKQLVPGKRYYWQVRIWDNKGKASGWSRTSYWETGLMNPAGWSAKWIELEGDTLRYGPAPHFRKEFSLARAVSKARVYVTSHGFFELYINGRKVGDEVLAPGWTSYGKRLQYRVYDVTSMLKNGPNCVGAVLGDGWYRGTLAWGDNYAIYGKRLGLLMQMRITLTDGSEYTVMTDGSWKGIVDGAIRMNDLYNGEIYDARKKLTGWNQPGYDESKWQNVMIGNYPYDNLIASEGSPIRKTGEIKPVKIFRTPKGDLVADMGQNMVGWIRLKVSGEKGTTIVLHHAEVLDKYGEFYTTNLRSAKCELKYTLEGVGTEEYEPRFTFMGFRYVKVEGFPGELAPENITGVVIHSDMKKTGHFESSEPLLNQLQHNIVWGQKGNFVDVPTDCPQRDERLGWTGDAQAFCRTAAFNFDVAPFFTKWLKDVMADQRPGGEVPHVVPDVLNPQGSVNISTSAGWGDVVTIAPWAMYTVYGDKNLLEKQYPGMKAWVEYIRKKAGDSYIWKGGSVFGDWLFYHPPVNNHPEPDGYTEHDFIATAFYSYSAQLLAKAAKELGKTDDETFYNDLVTRIKAAFNHEYVTPAGRVGTNSQTSYVLALMFDLLPDNLRQKAAGFLVEDIKSRSNHISSGFLGTPYICHVLTRFGYTDVAYDLLLQETYPSWLYPVTMGATTIWERWDGQKPDSTFQDPGMNSFNHYAYGAIGDWMYRVSAGLEAASPGYRHLLIQPHPTKRMDRVHASFESLYGTVESGWERKDGKIFVKIRIPANVTATVVLPVLSPEKVTEKGRSLDKANFSNIKMSDNNLVFSSGSGDYIFEFSED